MIDSGAPKWRPDLPMVTSGMIAAVLAVALLSFGMFRLMLPLPAPMEIAMAGLLALAGGAVVGAVFVRAISRPLRELAARADRVAHGDREAIGPLERHGTRELAAVTSSFMGMARSLSDRSDYIRTFARHVSHELKTPLTAIRGAAELVRDTDEMSAPDRRRFLSNVLSDVERLTVLLDRLHELALAENPALADDGGEAATPADIVKELAARYPQLAIALEGQADRPMALSPENAAIVFAHLFDNAVRFGASRARVCVRCEGDWLYVVVEDDGPGVSPGNRARVFEPFFTTRREQGGTGMGLAIVRAVLAAHGGEAQLDDGPGGARFVLRVPRGRELGREVGRARAPARNLHKSS